MRPDTLLPAEVLGKRFPHGSRNRYLGGCRCLPCRAANSRYESIRMKLRRAGLANGIVSAAKTRKKLKRLSRAGVGFRQVAKVSGVASCILGAIVAGRQHRVRQETERRVMKVRATDKAAGTTVDATETWEHINWLLANGWRKAHISKAIGQGGRALQLGAVRVTRRNALAIKQLREKYDS